MFFLFFFNKEWKILRDTFANLNFGRWSSMTKGGDKNNNYISPASSILGSCFITYINQQEALFFYFVLFLITFLTTLGFTNTSLCSILLIAESARGRVFRWIPMNLSSINKKDLRVSYIISIITTNSVILKFSQ